MAATAENGVKRRSSRLRFFRCFTAVDDEESCSPACEDVAVIDTYGGRVRRLSDFRASSSPVTSMQKKRFWIFSGVVDSVSPDSSRAKKHWRRKRRNAKLSESNNKLCRKQDNLNITNNSNKDMETETVEGSSISSSLSTNSMTSVSSEASTSSMSSSSSSRSLNSSSTCESKHNTIIDSALCLLVVSLLAVIVWGKVCAIVCTSTWLCIMFGRPSNLEERTQMRSASDHAVESEAYKKKIVLGGFLHRKCKHHI